MPNCIVFPNLCVKGLLLEWGERETFVKPMCMYGQGHLSPFRSRQASMLGYTARPLLCLCYLNPYFQLHIISYSLFSLNRLNRGRSLSSLCTCIISMLGYTARPLLCLRYLSPYFQLTQNMQEYVHVAQFITLMLLLAIHINYVVHIRNQIYRRFAFMFPSIS